MSEKNRTHLVIKEVTASKVEGEDTYLISDGVCIWNQDAESFDRNSIAYSPKDETVNSLNKEDLMHFFAFDHLPASLQETSKPFWFLATLLKNNTPNNDQAYFALQKLLEAKDCAVRAKLSVKKD